MADISAELSSELTRIIECPYPASLTGLAELLARANIPIIRACIQDRSRCALSKLVIIVYSALQLGAYTLRVLHRLCHAPEFRDELLVLKSGLLDALLSKATSTQQDFEDYAELCVLLLSRPLPEATPLPATAQKFFLHVFGKAVHSPNAETLKLVYHMLNGACRHLHSILPSDTRRQFDAALLSILRSNIAAKSSMLLLWVCGIVLLVEHSGKVKNKQRLLSTEHPVSTEILSQQWTTPSGQKLFGSTKDMHKTIFRIGLEVLLILKGEITDEEATDGIRIASRVLQSINREVLDSWPMSDKNNSVLFEKYPAKLMGSNIDQYVLFEALSFYAVLAGPQRLPREIVTLYESSISEVTRGGDPDHIAETLSVSLPLYESRIQEDIVRSLLFGVLNACASGATSRRMSNLIGLVDELTTATTTCVTLRSTVLRVLSSESMQGRLWNFVRNGPKNDCVGCCTQVASLQRGLISATTASLLNIALAAGPGESTLPHVLTAALINKQRKLPAITGHCQCTSSSDSPRHPPISLFQQASTQYIGQHLQDWSKRLNSELESQNMYQRDAIVRSVAQICADLEARCNTVEEPLRREKEKSAACEDQISELSQEIESLQARLVDAGYHLQGLEKDLDDAKEERDRLEQEKLEVTEEKERKGTRLQEVEAYLEESNRNASEALHAAQESFSAKELSLRSSILQYEEDLRTHEAQIEELRSTISELRESRAQQERSHYTLNEECEQYQARLRETEEMLENERANVSQQVDETARLETRILEYQHHLEDKETELKHTSRQLNDLQASYKELEQTSGETMKDMVAKHANEMQAATDRVDEERQAFSIQLETTRQDCQREKDDHDKTRSDLQRLQTEVSPLEHRIQELEDFCREQEEELDELKTLRRNVLASMGATLQKPQKPLAIRSTSRSQQDTVEPQTMREPRSHRRRKSANAHIEAPKAAIGIQGITNTAMENLANASFASSESYSSQGGGPTPKRSKPRSSFRAPTMHTPYTQKPMVTSKSAPKQLSPSKRSALRQMSPNRRHTVGFALAEAEKEDRAIEIRSARKRRGSLPDVEQADFDMDDDFMAGTPLTPGFMAGTGKIPDEDDATTTQL